METKKLAGGILSVSVKACITVLTIVLLYLAGRKAFDFGTAVFDEKSMDAKGSGYDVMVTIPSGATNNDVADILLNNRLKKFCHFFSYYRHITFPCFFFYFLTYNAVVLFKRNKRNQGQYS